MAKETVDLTIRALEPSDVPAWTAMMNLPGVRHGTLRTPFTPQAFFEARAKPNPGQHQLVGTLGGELVASAAVFQRFGRQSHSGEIILAVHDGHVGKGIGRQMLDALLDLADNWLGLRRVDLTVNVDNEAAIKLYRSVGFETEGTRRADTLRNGELIDSYAMARIRDAPAYEA